MKWFSCRCALASALLLVVISLASCAKEEPVAPVGFSDPGAAKSASAVDDKPDAALTKGDSGGTTDGSSISDDGDDISGTERKRRPGS